MIKIPINCLFSLFFLLYFIFDVNELILALQVNIKLFISSWLCKTKIKMYHAIFNDYFCVEPADCVCMNFYLIFFLSNQIDITFGVY